MMTKELAQMRRDSPDVFLHGSQRPRRSDLVFAEELPLTTNELCERLRDRQIAVSANGTQVASLSRSGTIYRVVTSGRNASFSEHAFGKARIVQAYGNGSVKLWGEHEGVRGVWMLSASGLRLVAALDVLEDIVPSPLGAVAVGTRGDPEYQTYVLGDALVVPRGACLAFDDQGIARGLIPFGTDRLRQWFCTPRDGRPRPDEQAGRCMQPLPFRAETAAKAYVYLGRLECLFRDGTSDLIWREGPAKRKGDGQARMTPEASRDGVDNAWVSADGMAIAQQLRETTSHRGISQKLMVNAKPVFEGSFFTTENDFRWSRDGSHFVALLSLLDTDGHQQEQRLVTNGGREEIIRAGTTAYEPHVDDAGRLAYVVRDVTMRRVVADTVTTNGFPYAWNVSQISDAVVANVLVGGKIWRIELPYGR